MYRILVANGHFPHGIGGLLKTEATTEQEGIEATLEKWKKGELPLPCLEYYMDVVAPEFLKELEKTQKEKLRSPWNPNEMSSQMKKQIVEKIVELIESQELRGILLRLYEKQETMILLIKPGETTHMNTLFKILNHLAAVPIEDY
jgi:hypothetical protein